MDLDNKSIHDLRMMAQSFGVTDLTSKTKKQLIQAIELKQFGLLPEPEVIIPKPEYDARLMTRPPSKMSIEDDILKILDPYIKMGLHVDFPDEESWRMRHGKREDNGTKRMPLRIVLGCAERIMK
jgi:hypothetical protein